MVAKPILIMISFMSYFRYNVSFMILTYFLPMAIMTGLYAAIGRELWGQQAIGEATAVQVESIKSKRRVSLFLRLHQQNIAFYE